MVSFLCCRILCMFALLLPAATKEEGKPAEKNAEIKIRFEVLLAAFTKEFNLEEKMKKAEAAGGDGKAERLKVLQERWGQLTDEQKSAWNQLQADQDQLGEQAQWRKLRGEEDLNSAWARMVLKWDDATVKERTEKLRKAWELTATNLATRMSNKGPFGGFELLMPYPEGYKFKTEEQKISSVDWPSKATWLNTCADADTRRGSFEACVATQLMTLSRLCDAQADNAALPKVQRVIIAHLDALKSGKVPSLGIYKKKVLWRYDAKLQTKGKASEDPSLQALVLGTMVQCAAAVKKPEYTEDAAALFGELVDLFHAGNFLEMAKEGTVNLNQVLLILRSMVQAALHIPQGSKIAGEMEQYVKALEKYLYGASQMKDKDVHFPHGENHLLQSAVLRWRSGKLDEEGKKYVKSHARNGATNIFGQNGRAVETPTFMPCGNLAGMVMSAEVTRDTAVIQKVFHYIEQTMDDFHMPSVDHVEDFDPQTSFSPELMVGGINYWITGSHRITLPGDCLDGFASALRVLEKLPKDIAKKEPVIGQRVAQQAPPKPKEEEKDDFEDSEEDTVDLDEKEKDETEELELDEEEL